MTNQRLYIEKKDTIVNLSIDNNNNHYKFNIEQQNQQDSAKDDVITIPSQLPNYLTSPNQVFIIDSIKSGTGRSSSSSNDIYHTIINPLFKLLDINYQYFKTISSKSISKFANQFNPQYASTIIFISGDTSINEFINGLPTGTTNDNNKISIFPIPNGTGNSLALSLNLQDQLSALTTLLTSTNPPHPLHLYTIQFPTGSYLSLHNEKHSEITHKLNFLVVFSWAFHASLVADSDTPELRKHGLERFKIAAANNLNQEQKYDAECYINSKKIDGPFAYWLVTGSDRFEPTFEISPHSDILENGFYLVAFKTGQDIMKIMYQVYDKGNHINNPDVIYEKLIPGDEIILKTKNSSSIRKRRFCLDGSIIVLPEQEEHEIKIQIGDYIHNNWQFFIIH
ncbi:uncharacterized protein J8A68_001230 [[Candida] subhashii]|uniref:DAGKc domain-containing protein n=1 Tax=[Candida] subhashii TaxID=561895 RepID=A0A8J5QG99_9ASCO|nr:uncharacterized protein J8A68_001230 [[Candida] subhashii]KAG7665174.1 hypothetical protein J8A68_001230 [[Candida] subhashii]